MKQHDKWEDSEHNILPNFERIKKKIRTEDVDQNYFDFVIDKDPKELSSSLTEIKLRLILDHYGKDSKEFQNALKQANYIHVLNMKMSIKFGQLLPNATQTMILISLFCIIGIIGALFN